MPRLAEKLGDLKAQSRYRALSLPNGIDLTSNDYLGMAQHPDLRAAAHNALDQGIDIGAAGSRLLRGHTQSHQSLEDFAAAHFNAERTLFFATGFQANYALLTTLPERHDIILYDSLVHASVRDGIQASHAQSFKFPHNDLNALENLLKKHTKKTCWIAVESVYSMDGDTAPLAEMYALAQRYGATLIVDEAHSTGIFGTQGKGLCWDIIRKNGYANLITLHTCGKAIGVAGGLVCASGEIIDTLINRARPFIYSTAPMPLQAFLVQKNCSAGRVRTSYPSSSGRMNKHCASPCHYRKKVTTYAPSARQAYPSIQRVYAYRLAVHLRLMFYKNLRLR